MRRAPLLCLAAVLLAPSLSADVLETREGRVLEGIYLGGTREAVRFQTGDSAVEVFPTEEVRALRFSSPARQPATTPTAPPPAPPAPPAAAPPQLARVPAGTTLRVRLVDGIDSRTSAAGDRFGATLATGLGVDGHAVLPTGTKLYGQVAALRSTGPVASRMELELTQLMVQGELIDIVTGSQQPVPAPEAAPASASTIPARPGFAAGSELEFQLLQPVEVTIPR